MKKVLSFCLIIYIIILLTACEKQVLINKTLYCFDTTVEITFKALKSEATTIADEISSMLYLYSDLADNFSAKDVNNIYMINHADDYVTASDELINLISFSLHMQDETNGYFNPLMGNITTLYKELLINNDLNVLSNLDDEMNNLNDAYISIIDKQIKIIGNATIDLGGIAKGYALNEVVKYLINNNINYYLINCGYSSIAMGEKNKEAFRVGLKYDDSKILNLKNTTIGSCSIHEQKAIIDGKLYHHIINPKTGLNENTYSTIYLIGDDASIIDALATACFNMPIEDVLILAHKYHLKYLIYQNDHLTYNNL